MIVVDSSALIAIAETEADWKPLLASLLGTDHPAISQMNYVEAGMVLTSRGFFPGRAEYDRWLEEFGVVVDRSTPLDAYALEAFLQFGRGRHPAKLNLGDCFAYALAKALDAPLLFKGNDFSRTDIRPALQPT